MVVVAVVVVLLRAATPGPARLAVSCQLRHPPLDPAPFPSLPFPSLPFPLSPSCPSLFFILCLPVSIAALEPVDVLLREQFVHDRVVEEGIIFSHKVAAGATAAANDRRRQRRRRGGGLSW